MRIVETPSREVKLTRGELTRGERPRIDHRETLVGAGVEAQRSEKARGKISRFSL
jgi:hypothetical protein